MVALVIIIIVVVVAASRLVLLPASEASVVAHVTLRGARAGSHVGALIVHTNDTSPAFARIVVPITATVLSGAYVRWGVVVLGR